MDLALTLTLVGLTVVFAALIILAFLISVLSKAINLFKKDGNIGKEKDLPVNPANNISNISTETKSDVNTDVKNDSLIAVITAAIYASMKQQPDFKIRVKSIKRVQDNSPAWNLAGKIALFDAKVR